MPTGEDRRQFDANEKQRAAVNPEIAPKTPAEKDAAWLILGEWPIIDARTAHALWKKHGGSVGFGSLGSCVSFKGELAFLKHEAKEGRLRFHNKVWEQEFWRAVSDTRQRADVVLKDQAKIDETFKRRLASFTYSEPTTKPRLRTTN